MLNVYGDDEIDQVGEKIKAEQGISYDDTYLVLKKKARKYKYST